VFAANLMNRLFSTLLPGLLIFVLYIPASAQKRKPRFRDYPVEEIFRGVPARVKFRIRWDDRSYGSDLREGAANGPNFAGHFTIVTWGCGSDCYDIAVVDSRTGRVWFAPFTGSIGLSFRRDSRLLIVDSQAEREKTFPNGLPKGFGRAPEIFFVWRGNKFVQIYPRDGTKPLPAFR